MLGNGKKPEKVLLSAEEQATLPRAGLMRRLAALLYDMFLVVAIWFVLAYAMQLVLGPASTLVDGEIQSDPILSLLYFTMMIASAATFYIWFWQHTGQTLGMIAWRIKVVGIDNRAPDLKSCLIRFFLAWPAFLLAGLGYLWLYIDANNDALHEKLSGNKTILLPKNARPF